MRLLKSICFGIVLGLAPLVAADDTMTVHRTEPYLLHKAVPVAMFGALQIWSPQDRDFRALRTTETPAQAPFLIVHLWADYCKPCREEFPLWRDLVDAFARKYKERVRIVFLTETSGSEEMRAFLQANEARMPRGPHYYDSGEALLSLLRRDVPGGAVPLPVTILLDERRIVRHAFVGPITARRAELVAALDRLVQTVPR